MGTFAKASLTQQATYWAPTEPDGTGGYDFSTTVPVVVACRWQTVNVRFRDAVGREAISDAVVYPDRELTVAGYIALGDLSSVTDPVADSRCHEIRQATSSPTLDGVDEFFKVMV